MGDSLPDEDKSARATLALVHARHWQDRVTSIAMNLADMKTKRARDNEIKRITDKCKPGTAKAIIELAKKLYGDKNDIR